MKLKALVAATVATGMVGGAFAAFNPAAPVVGGLPISTGGDLNVTLTIADIIHISGLADIALGTYAGDSVDEAGSDTFCVFRNGTGNYEVTLDSLNTSGADFRLYDGVANYIGYTVDYTDSAGAIAGATSGQLETPRTAGADNTDPVCAVNGDNVTLAVTVPAANMDTAVPGSYTDTIIVTVSAL